MDFLSMEIWKPLRDYPSYNISSEGRILNIKTQQILKTRVNDKGYEIATLRKNNKPCTVRVHKLVAETFLGEQVNMDVRHRDLNLLNNRADNLYWSSRSETISDAFERGTKTPTRCRPVTVVETGETFASIRECSRSTGCQPSEICRQLEGRVPHVKDLHFTD